MSALVAIGALVAVTYPLAALGRWLMRRDLRMARRAALADMSFAMLELGRAAQCAVRDARKFAAAMAVISDVARGME